MLTINRLLSAGIFDSIFTIIAFSIGDDEKCV